MKLLFSLLLFCNSLLCVSQSNPLQVFGASGRTVSNEGNYLQGTIGEAIIFTAGTTNFTQGFNQPLVNPICEELAQLINTTDNQSLCLDQSFKVELENNYAATGDKMEWYLESDPSTILANSKAYTYSSSVTVEKDSLYAIVTEGFCTDTSAKIPFKVRGNNSIVFEEGNSALCNGNVVLKLTIPSSEIQWLLDDEEIDGATQDQYTVLVKGEYGVSIPEEACSEGNLTQTISSDLTSVTVTTSGDDLICSASGNYQWYIQIDDRTYSIVGATQKNYTPLFNGSYKVEVYTEFCQGVSDTKTYSLAQYEAQRFAQFIEEDQVILEKLSTRLHVSPNPNNGVFTLNYFGATNQLIAIKIYNTIGQLVFRQQVASANKVPISLNVPRGLYIFVTEINGTLYKEKIVID